MYIQIAITTVDEIILFNLNPIKDRLNGLDSYYVDALVEGVAVSFKVKNHNPAHGRYVLVKMVMDAYRGYLKDAEKSHRRPFEQGASP